MAVLSLNLARFLVPGFLAVQSGLVYWVASGERLPAPPDLSQVPVVLDRWERAQDTPVDPDVAVQLHADRLFNRTYVEQGNVSWIANFFVAWFQSQRGGASPHSPQVCLPGSGWIAARTDEVDVDSSVETIRVNRYIATHGEERAVILYWYQTPGRAIASEWAAKFWIIPDAIRTRRTDTALVRVTVWTQGRTDEAATEAALTFTRKAYPDLLNRLPR